jgi:hypothetical protein
MDSEPDRVEIGKYSNKQVGEWIWRIWDPDEFYRLWCAISEINQENEESDEKQVRVSPSKPEPPEYK